MCLKGSFEDGGTRAWAALSFLNNYCREAYILKSSKLVAAWKKRSYGLFYPFPYKTGVINVLLHAPKCPEREGQVSD